MDSQFQITYAIGKYNIRKMYNVDFRRKKQNLINLFVHH